MLLKKMQWNKYSSTFRSVLLLARACLQLFDLLADLRLWNSAHKMIAHFGLRWCSNSEMQTVMIKGKRENKRRFRAQGSYPIAHSVLEPVLQWSFILRLAKDLESTD